MPAAPHEKFNSAHTLPAHVFLYVLQPIHPESPDLLVPAIRHSVVAYYISRQAGI